MKDPKVGERVMVYQGRLSFKAEIRGIFESGLLHIKADDEHNRDSGVVHPNQCRRLKKKERRRIWVKYNANGFVNRNFVASEARPPLEEFNWVEFIEVKKK